MTAVSREADVAHVFVEELRIAAPGDVHELPAANARDESIEDAVAIRKKRHEIAIARDGRIDFRTWKVGETIDPRVRPPRPPRCGRVRAAPPYQCRDNGRGGNTDRSEPPPLQAT